MARVFTKKKIEMFIGLKNKKVISRIKEPRQVTFRAPKESKDRFDKFIEENKLIKNSVLLDLFEEFLDRVRA